MSVETPTIKRRCDYRKPDYAISKVDLTFNLDPNKTRIVCVTQVKRNGQHQKPMVLDGNELELVNVALNGKEFTDYQLQDESLTLNNVPEQFELRIETLIDPENNSSLEGLYLSSGAYCTQCEAEGFRKITYFLDRPDVLADYTVTIYADKAQFPYLLSNGNKVGEGDDSNGKHWVKWHDPFKKPCYLFALVAGDFDLLNDAFETKSGKSIALELFVDRGMLGRGQHALDSLKKAMKWDEEVFGLEYDLDTYMVVAVDFFNMGAMENKGLNVFNSKYVLADPESATDEDFFNIESVIAHEYFHNWTGNRVTCRDWFQLSLKEGLTVFRDQQFSADMSSPIVNRIKNVKVMREHQFAEDSGPMSHPIRPDEVMEMNNFYTVTVYDKGAEVIRMMHTLLGAEGFRAGMDLYFERFDGHAVTCDDFVQSMQDATNVDLSQFKVWYQQSGTPLVKVKESFDAEHSTYSITLEQVNSPTADQQQKFPLHIPISLELIDNSGKLISLSDEGETRTILQLKESQQTFKFKQVDQNPTASLLGNFSAPIRLEQKQSAKKLIDIVMYAKDAFARWDACQSLYSSYIHQTSSEENKTTDLIKIHEVLEAVNSIVKVSYSDTALGAEMLTLPSFETLCQQGKPFEVIKLFNAREHLKQTIASEMGDAWKDIYQQQKSGSYQYQQQDVNQRRLKNIALSYLAKTEWGESAIESQYSASDNMTDSLAALHSARDNNLNLFDKLMNDFENKWQDDPLVLDKWFALHAGANRNDILARLSLLFNHKGYKINNPNRVRSLVGTFTFYNPLGFHAIDGSGYRFVTDYLIKLDSINPQVTARLVTPLTQWRQYDDSRQQLMKQQLARIVDQTNLSNDVFEKVSKSLNFHS